MKLGDVVAYTPLGVPVRPDSQRCVVVGVLPETAYDNELIWVSDIGTTNLRTPEVTLEESGDFTKVEK